MASRNGLNPKIRGPKGVGFGRALPSAFGFDNGIWPNGGSQYLNVPRMVGSVLPNQMTIECWFEYPNPVTDLGGIFSFYEHSGNSIMTLKSTQSSPPTVAVNFISGGSEPMPFAYGTKTSMACTIDMTTGVVQCFRPGLDPFLGPFGASYTSLAGNTISHFEFFTSFGPFIGPGNGAIDEFRMYKKIITNDQFIQNYNNGVGNNPFETESLLVWYKFEQFENLDFSMTQDGSDMRIGIKDMSGNFNHAQPFNMITDPAAPGYNLKPF